jgi:hypothetical protein
LETLHKYKKWDFFDKSVADNKTNEVLEIDAAYLRGKIPGTQSGNVAVFSEGGLILGLLVYGENIASASITSDKISAGAITSLEIFDGTIKSEDLADNAVSGDKVLNDTIKNEDIAANAINSAKIEDGTITYSDIKDNTVSTDDLADNPAFEPQTFLIYQM